MKNIGKFVLEKLAERRGASRSEAGLVRLPNLNISYKCDPLKVPVFLDPIQKNQLQAFRRMLEQELGDKGIHISNKFYGEGQNYDGEVDQLRASEKGEANPLEALIFFHTVGSSPFTRKFMPLAQEILALEQSFDIPTNYWTQGFGSMVNDYLVKNHGLSIEDFRKRLDIADLKLGQGRKARDTAAQVYFESKLGLFLGTLAGMDKQGLKFDQYYRELGKALIYPIKNESDQETFTYFSRKLRGLN